MTISVRPLGLLVSFLLLATLVGSCDDGGPTAGDGARVRVEVATEGAFLDDGYQLTVADLSPRAIGVDASVEVTGVPPGDVTVSLTGLSASCEAADNPRTVAVPPGEIVTVRFDVTCGTIVFASDRSGDREIYRMRLDGTDLTAITTAAGTDFEPAISRDGTQIAFTSTRTGDRFEIHRIGIDGTGTVRLTNEEGRSPSWSPDGTRIVFESARDGNSEIYVMNADGTGVVRLTNDPGFDDEAEWSPDGSRIVFASARAGEQTIHLMRPDGTDVRQLSAISGEYPTWSPAGDRIAFVETGRQAIVIVDLQGVRVRRIPLVLFAFQLSWQPGTRILFASDQTGEIYSIDPGGGTPTRLTEDPTLDVTPTWGP